MNIEEQRMTPREEVAAIETESAHLLERIRTSSRKAKALLRKVEAEHPATVSWWDIADPKYGKLSRFHTALKSWLEGQP